MDGLFIVNKVRFYLKSCLMICDLWNYKQTIYALDIVDYRMPDLHIYGHD
jgi:hypothetical protein